MVITMLAVVAVHAPQIPRYYFADVPASVTNDPWGYAFSIFGLLGSSLLALQRCGVLIRRMVHTPHPWRHPVTINRLMWLAMLVSVLFRIAPDVLFVTLWRDIAPITRFEIGRWNRVFDGLSIVPMGIWWGLAVYSSRLTEHQLARNPIPVELWPTMRQFAHATWFVIVLLFVSVVIAFG